MEARVAQRVVAAGAVPIRVAMASIRLNTVAIDTRIAQRGRAVVSVPPIQTHTLERVATLTMDAPFHTAMRDIAPDTQPMGVAVAGPRKHTLPIGTHVTGGFVTMGPGPPKIAVAVTFVVDVAVPVVTRVTKGNGATRPTPHVVTLAYVGKNTRSIHAQVTLSNRALVTGPPRRTNTIV